MVKPTRTGFFETFAFKRTGLVVLKILHLLNLILCSKIRKADKFEKLYGNTYIGKNPTKLRNSYHILKFNFSGISTDTPESTIKGFKEKVVTAIRSFIGIYQIDFYINEEQEAENILYNLFNAFALQKPEEKIYNSNMCLYFLSDYIRLGRIPTKLIDMNITSDYSKLGSVLDLCKGKEREKVIEKTISGEGIISEITQKFTPAMEFTETDLVSMLYYLGYLTIVGDIFEKPIETM